MYKNLKTHFNEHSFLLNTSAIYKGLEPLISMRDSQGPATRRT